MNCLICGSEITSPRRKKYCSKQCAAKAKADQREQSKAPGQQNERIESVLTGVEI